jgi:hypothetical protein
MFFQFFENITKHTNIRFELTNFTLTEHWDYVTIYIGNPKTDLGRVGSEQWTSFG